jgi:uncharacterized membrane-anchored protein
MMRKVPEVLIYFWIVKLLTTAMGESTSDYLVYHINPYMAVTLGFIGFVIAMTIQLSARRYIAWVYWLAVVMVAIFGTMAADVLHVGFHIPYYASTGFFAIALAIILITWYKCEKNLSIHSIDTHRREFFYWLTVLATFALGTAAGDLTAFTLGLGFFHAGILFAIIFAIPALGYWLFKLNGIFAFWFAYIITRPLGASFADWASKPKSVGGLGYGDGYVSLVLTIFIVGFVFYLSTSHKDTKSL